MKHIVATIALIIVLTISGCTTVGMTAKQAAITTSHIIALEDSFERVEPIVENNIKNVNSDDREKIRQAWNTLLTIRNEIKDDDPSKVLTNVARSQDLYERARSAYITLRPVAKNLIANNAINSENAAMLNRIDNRAQTLDEKMQTLEENKATVAAIQFARDVIPLVSKILLAV